VTTNNEEDKAKKGKIIKFNKAYEKKDSFKEKIKNKSERRIRAKTIVEDALSKNDFTSCCKKKINLIS
jgi:DNA polymerase III delta prime subunit